LAAVLVFGGAPAVLAKVEDDTIVLGAAISETGKYSTNPTCWANNRAR